MKKIILHTASSDNSGSRIAAGAKVAVGDGKSEFSAARAKELVSSGLADEAGTPRKGGKSSAQPKATND